MGIALCMYIVSTYLTTLWTSGVSQRNESNPNLSVVGVIAICSVNILLCPTTHGILSMKMN